MVREHIQKIPQRDSRSHKGDYGRVLVVAGSRGMTGAATLSCMGSMRSGSGLVYCIVPESVEQVMSVKLTEVIIVGAKDLSEGCLAPCSRKEVVSMSKSCDVVAIGPGLGSNVQTFRLVKGLVTDIEKPLVLDADGLNALAGETDILRDRKFPAVITPHPGEMARLLGLDKEEVQQEREEVASGAAERFGCVVVLKGHNTVVASPDGAVFVNTTGSSAMATAGMGDILTGMIASFIGQGLDEFSSAVCAVYLHGSAGDLAAKEKGAFSTIATDVLAFLPEAFRRAGI